MLTKGSEPIAPTDFAKASTTYEGPPMSVDPVSDVTVLNCTGHT